MKIYESSNNIVSVDQFNIPLSLLDEVAKTLSHIGKQTQRDGGVPFVHLGYVKIGLAEIFIVSFFHQISFCFKGSKKVLIVLCCWFSATATLTFCFLSVSLYLNFQCAVIQLPSQTLLLSVSDKACRLIGMLFPGVS